MKQKNSQIMATFLKNCRKRIDNLLDKYLSTARKSKNLYTAMRYVVLGGGKRLRPLLVYAVGKVYGANLDVLDIPACAIEMIHSFSLIHDDLPAMDNDDLRHGKLTCHKAFNEATAVLAGDALAIFAFQILSESKILTPKQAILMSKTLASASGPTGMACGQDIDIKSVGRRLSINRLENMYLLKTGALLRAAVKLGALAADIDDENELKNLDHFAKNVGLAFQIQDDILNIESNFTKLGKNVSTDSTRNKITYPALVGMKVAKAKVQQLYQLANKNLLQLKINPYTLQMLIEHLRQRNH